MYKCKSKYEEYGNHTYAVYKDPASKKYRAIQLTHIYDPKKIYAIDNGYLKVEKFKYFKYPGGVKNTYYDSDVNGKNLYFGKNSKHKFVGNVPAVQAKRIKDFATKKAR